MEYAMVALVAALTFGLCFLLDKGFTRVFRNKAQHKTGLAVHLNKSYAVIGLLLLVLGVVAVMRDFQKPGILFYGGLFVLLMGVGLVAYYLSFGLYYDENTFLCTSFGRKNRTYRFGQIRQQRLYQVTGGVLVVELYMDDGSTVSLQSSMAGAYDFLDYAFWAWCRQNGKDGEKCDFHDPANSCWFPRGDE